MVNTGWLNQMITHPWTVQALPASKCYVHTWTYFSLKDQQENCALPQKKWLDCANRACSSINIIWYCSLNTFCSISYTKDSLWALNHDAWSPSSTLHDRSSLAAHTLATGDVCLMPSQFLWSPFSVLGPCPLEGRSVLLYTYICFLFELGSTALWKGIIFQSFVGPQDISVHEGKEYPPFAAFQVNSHSSHFSQLQFIIRGLCACCIPLTALSHKVIAKTHTTPKRPHPLYMAWITVKRLKEKKTQRGMRGFLLFRGSCLGAECVSPPFGLAREPGGPYSVDNHVHRVILQGWLRFLICLRYICYQWCRFCPSLPTALNKAGKITRLIVWRLWKLPGKGVLPFCAKQGM